MKQDTFIKRLENGGTNNFTYDRDGDAGLICVWKHGDSFVLTWEECPMGEQYDESKYSRDERHVFSTIQQLFEFLEGRNLKLNDFTP